MFIIVERKDKKLPLEEILEILLLKFLGGILEIKLEPYSCYCCYCLFADKKKTCGIQVHQPPLMSLAFSNTEEDSVCCPLFSQESPIIQVVQILYLLS